MTVRYLGPQHIGDELHHYYRQATAPADANLLQVGDLWSDTTANVVKRCTSLSPITFVSIEGGSAAHSVLSATHDDSFATDTPVDGDVLTWVDANSRWEAVAAAGGGGGDLTRAGGNTTEATTTSTATVDILTVSGLSIAVGTPVLVMATYRKSAGAADNIRIGLKLNTTEVRAEMVGSTTVDQAESMLFVAWFIYGVSSYLRSGYVNAGKNSEGNFNADMPTATLTDVVIIGSCDNGLITMGVDECHVYTFAVS